MAPTERRGEIIDEAVGAAIVGAIFGPVLGGVASLVGTEAAFGAVGVSTLVLALWARTTEAPPRDEPQPLARLLHAVGDRRIATAAWLVALPSLLLGTLSVLAPLRLSDLGLGAIAIGAAYLLSASVEAVLSPVLGRLSDRRGRLLPLRVALFASAAVAVLLPWPDGRFLLAGLVVVGGIAFGSFWAPAMSLLTDLAERRGLQHGFTFALINLAWAPGQVLGSSGGGALAHATSDTVPYLVLAGTCLLTFALLWRSESFS